jgi:hypothetical protein
MSKNNQAPELVKIKYSELEKEMCTITNWTSLN